MEKWEYEENRKDFIQDFYYNKLKFCGCGNPEDTLMLIKNILNVINMKKNKSYEEYQKELRECFNLKEEKIDNYNFSINNGIIQFILYTLDECRVLTHGGSIGGAWLDNYGKELLKYLNELSDEEMEWILDH